MKKLLALLAVVLCVVSCQTEPEGLDVNVGGEIDAIVNVTIPEVETRAAANPNSALGAFANVDLGTEDDTKTIRYILQVYYNNEPSLERLVKYSDGKSVAFEVRLVPGRNYQFVVWADVVTRKDDTDNHYNTSDLKSITLNGEWNAMDESRDAFTATKLIEGYNGAMSIDMSLKRPFAKLRVVTTDIKNLTNLRIVPDNAVVEYTTKHRVAFNAFTGKAADASESKTHTYTINPYSNETNTGAEYTLFTDYFFAENDVVKFNFDVYEDEAKTKLIKSNAFNTDINVKRNYLTTIKGNILTDGKGFQVTIEDTFENAGSTDPDYEYTTITSAVELLRAIGTSGNYIVMNDIKVTNADVSLASTLAATRTTAEGKVTTINLNGKTITVTNNNTNNAPLATVAAGNTLFLEGDGNIVLTEGSTGSFIKNNGNVVLTSGEINNNSTAAAVVEGAIIVDEGTVNDTKAETLETENWLDHVRTNGGTYVFTKDMTDSEIIVVTANDVVLDGNGKTLTSTAGRAINVSGAENVTIKNLTINASGERAINIIQNATNITIENVTATAANYTVNVASSAPNANVVINNSDLTGLNTVNIGAENTNVVITNTKLTSDDKTETESYDAISINKDGANSHVTVNGGEIVLNGDSVAAAVSCDYSVVTFNDTKGASNDDVVYNNFVIVYGNYAYTFTSLNEALKIAKDNEEVTVARSFSVSEPLVIEEGQIATINLNGKTISNPNGYAIENYGALTINGEGNVDGLGNIRSHAGKVTINGGTFTGSSDWGKGTYQHILKAVNTEVVINGGTFDATIKGMTNAMINVSENSVVTINGGTFKNVNGVIPQFAPYMFTYEKNGKLIINDGDFYGGWRFNGETATTDIYGGNFTVSYDGQSFHAASTHVLTVYGGVCNLNNGGKLNPTSHCATGYKAIETSDNKYMVVTEDVDVIASTPAEVLSAMKVAGQTVYVMPTADGSAHKLEGKLSMAEGVKLIGMGETPVKLFNDWGSNAFANQAHFTNTHIENIYFTNNLIIDAGIANGNVKFVNCVFGGDLAHQGVHFDSGKGTITFENCTFIGRNMFGSSLENVVFNNCTFLNKKSSLTGADKWTGVNMWGKYEFNNCTFDTEAHCNVKCDGVVAAFNNCEYVDNRDIETVINNGQNFNATITF